MATLTIRDLDDALKRSLRVRAAQRNHSMEEEARQILRAVLRQPDAPEAPLVDRVRARFAGLGDVELPATARVPVRAAPTFDARSSTRVARRSRLSRASK